MFVLTDEVEVIISAAVTELSDLELALIGGGIGDVVFS
jgi:hypothetical protein